MVFKNEMWIRRPCLCATHGRDKSGPYGGRRKRSPYGDATMRASLEWIQKERFAL
jgi:hypothetical protein